MEKGERRSNSSKIEFALYRCSDGGNEANIIPLAACATQFLVLPSTIDSQGREMPPHPRISSQPPLLSFLLCSQEMTSIDNVLKQKLNNYNLAKGQLQGLQRKKT